MEPLIDYSRDHTLIRKDLAQDAFSVIETLILKNADREDVVAKESGPELIEYVRIIPAVPALVDKFQSSLIPLSTTSPLESPYSRLSLRESNSYRIRSRHSP